MMIKRSVMSLMCLAALAACSPQNAPPAASGTASETASAAALPPAAEGTVNIETARGTANVPLNPERVAVYDWGMLDTLTALGVKVGATTDQTGIPALEETVKNAVHVGTLFEPNFEKLNEYKPQLIITGSRTAKVFDELAKVAPTIEMTADTKNMRASAEERIDAFAAVFNRQAEAEALKARINESFAATKAAAEGKGNGLVIIVNAGKIAAFGPDSRLGGWIHRDVGVPAADAAIKEGSHGQPVSFEYIKQTNPDWLFVLDRSAAIGQEGEAAQKVLDNPLVRETTAWQKGQVVYLQPSAYLAAGGAGQLLESTKQLREAFEAAK